MRHLVTSAYEIAEQYIGTKEIAGVADNPLVVAMLKLDAGWPESDEVPWCSAFVNWIAWQLNLPRSQSLRARSWLNVGTAVSLGNAEQGMDVVILKRGKGEQPGPEVIKAPGHVGFYSYHGLEYIHLLGGNQGDKVSIGKYKMEDVLDVRRLA